MCAKTGFEYGDNNFSMYGGMDGGFGDMNGGFMLDQSQEQTNSESKEGGSRVSKKRFVCRFQKEVFLCFSVFSLMWCFGRLHRATGTSGRCPT